MRNVYGLEMTNLCLVLGLTPSNTLTLGDSDFFSGFTIGGVYNLSVHGMDMLFNFSEPLFPHLKSGTEEACFEECFWG